MVNPFQHPSDFEAAMLGSFGFSTNAIAKRTGLTKCQVTYRLGRFGIYRRDYREGKNIGAEAVVRVAMKELHNPLSKQLRGRLGDLE